MFVNKQAIEERAFGLTRAGQAVSLFTLRNKQGLSLGVTNYGGTVTSLQIPDRNGRFDNVVLAYDSLQQYESSEAYFGALVGRFANRIAAGRFSLDGQDYQLAVNQSPNHLHGGERGFDKVIWKAIAEQTARGPSLLLNYHSRGGEEGYPGTLNVHVRYTLGEDNSLVIDYQAECDRATPVNLTHHSYFNLSGDPGRDVLRHQLEINADYYTPVDRNLVPTGEIAPVGASPLDFRRPLPIGGRIDSNHEQMVIAGGYDHNYVLNGDGAGEATFAARVSEPESGRVMEVHTTEPGMQFYSGNFLADYGPRCGFCLETQHFPDSPNQPGFPSTILRPGQAFRSRTIHTFSTLID